jgi:hypothetical protein
MGSYIEATYPQYVDAIERRYRYKLTENKEPAWVAVPRGGEKHFTPAETDDAVLRVDVFKDANNNQDPQTVRFGINNGTVIVPTPLPTPVNPNLYASPRYDKSQDQGTNYWCGPFTAVQLLYELYGYKLAQQVLATLAGTTTAGSGHGELTYAIETAAKQIGHKVTSVWQNFSTTGWKAVGEMIADPNVALGIHCLYRNKWGHYMYPIYIDMDRKVICLIDSLNDDNDVIEVPFAEMEQWIANTYGGQPSLWIVWNNG